MDRVAAESLHHQKVLKLPVDDEWRGLLHKLRDAVHVALGFQTISPSGVDDGGRRAAVARHVASDAKLLERHPSAEVRENDRETRGAALDHFHLQYGRCPNPPLHSASSQRPSNGIPNVIGGCCRMVTLTLASMPSFTSTCGMRPVVHT